MRWCVRSSSAVCSVAIYGHPRIASAYCFSDRARSARCPAVSTAPATDWSRSRDRQSPPGLLSRPAFRSRDTDLVERGVRKRNFRRRGTFQPFSSKAPSSVRQALSQTPLSSHCFSRRQQVDGEGYSSGRKCHAAPACNIHRMPSKQLRFGAGGRPRPSLRRFAAGNNGPINSHCLSVNSFFRFFMTEAQHRTRLRHKYSL